MAAKMHCESSRQLGFALSYTPPPPSTLKRRGKNSIYGNLECLFRLDYSAVNPESHVCVCVGSPSVYMIPSSTFSTCFFPSGRCFTNGMTTIWSMLLTWAAICCMLVGRKPHKHLHSGSWRENKELQRHSEHTVTIRFQYMFLLSY